MSKLPLTPVVATPTQQAAMLQALDEAWAYYEPNPPPRTQSWNGPKAKG